VFLRRNGGPGLSASKRSCNNVALLQVFETVSWERCLSSTPELRPRDLESTSYLILHRLMPALLDKPERWRKRAEQTRTIAAGMRDTEAKRVMLSLAKSYEELAKPAEDRKHASQR
jgi:hypothetical protein